MARSGMRLRDAEAAYAFTDVTMLVDDFFADIERWNDENGGV